MRIMGIDPGYAIVGVGLVDYDNVRFSLVEYGAITTPAEAPFETRLRQIYDDMVGLITQYRPDAVAMEQALFHHQSHHRHCRGGSEGSTAAGRGAAGRAGIQLYAAAGQIGGGGLRQGRKGAGDGNDPPPVKSQIRAPAR